MGTIRTGSSPFDFGACAVPFPLPHAVCGGGPGRGAPADADRCWSKSLRPVGYHPSPVPSPLVPRGEGGLRSRGGTARRKGSRWRPTEPSPPGPLPRCAGEGENSIPLRPGFCRSPSPAQFVGEGRGGGPPAVRRDAFRRAVISRQHPSPAVGGGVASRREERAKGLAGERASPRRQSDPSLAIPAETPPPRSTSHGPRPRRTGREKAGHPARF